MTPDQIARATTIAQKIAAKYSILHATPADDLVQDGLLGLWKNRDKYDPARSSWATFARVYLRAAIGRAAANRARTIRVPEYEQQRARTKGYLIAPDPVSMDKPNESGNLPEYADERTDGPAVIERRDSIRRLHAALDRLPEYEQDLIHAVYFEGRLLREVGAQRNRSRQAVQQRLADITTRLRHSMGASC